MAILTISQALQYATRAGFSGDSAARIVSIAMCESNLNTLASNTTGNTAGVDRGLVQINSYYHPEVTDACAYDPACAMGQAYRISSGGTNFTPWATYNNGCSDTKIATVRSVQNMGASSGSVVSTASVNGYPKGQCTWWACQRYHDLTGYYIPWMGNANQWSAMAATAPGWVVSSTPVVPSIIVLQAGVQLADPTYGHVAVVESINSDGTVHTSDQNWAGITYPNTTYVDFRTGQGVSFVYASGAASTLAYTPQGSGSTIGSIVSTTIETVSGQAHNIINTVPGFQGICEALDIVEQFVPFTLPTSAQQALNTATQNNDIQIFGWDTGIVNPFGVAQSAQAAVQLPADTLQAIFVFATTNAMAFIVRSIFVLVGLILFLGLMGNVFDALFNSQTAQNAIGDVADFVHV